MAKKKLNYNKFCFQSLFHISTLAISIKQQDRVIYRMLTKGKHDTILFSCWQSQSTTKKNYCQQKQSTKQISFLPTKPKYNINLFHCRQKQRVTKQNFLPTKSKYATKLFLADKSKAWHKFVFLLTKPKHETNLFSWLQKHSMQQIRFLADKTKARHKCFSCWQKQSMT